MLSFVFNVRYTVAERDRWLNYEQDTSAKFPTAIQPYLAFRSPPAPTAPPTAHTTMRPFRQGSGWIGFNQGDSNKKKTKQVAAREIPNDHLGELWDHIEHRSTPTLRATRPPTVMPTWANLEHKTTNPSTAPFAELSLGALSYARQIALSKDVLSRKQKAAQAAAAAAAEDKTQKMLAQQREVAEWESRERAKAQLLEKMGESTEQAQETMAVEEQRHNAQERKRREGANGGTKEGRKQNGERESGLEAKRRATRPVKGHMHTPLQRQGDKDYYRLRLRLHEQKLAAMRVAQAQVAAAAAEVQVAELNEMEQKLLTAEQEQERHHPTRP
jgi:hypothetical protein